MSQSRFVHTAKGKVSTRPESAREIAEILRISRSAASADFSIRVHSVCSDWHVRRGIFAHHSFSSPPSRNRSVDCRWVVKEPLKAKPGRVGILWGAGFTSHRRRRLHSGGHSLLRRYHMIGHHQSSVGRLHRRSLCSGSVIWPSMVIRLQLTASASASALAIIASSSTTLIRLVCCSFSLDFELTISTSSTITSTSATRSVVPSTTAKAATASSATSTALRSFVHANGTAVEPLAVSLLYTCSTYGQTYSMLFIWPMA